jgi:heat shock protein HslJ
MKKVSIFILLAVYLAACTPAARRGVELDGTRWRVQLLEDQEILADTFLTLKFEEGKISGSAGCNRFGASYTIRSGGNLSIEMPYRQLQLCNEPVGVMQQEDRFIEIFRRVAKFRVAGDQLSFLDERGNVSKYTLQFEAGEFFGTTICRDFRGRYQAEGDSMQIFYLEMTNDVNCDETMALEEGRFTTLLGETEQYNVCADRLEINTMRGKKLVFVAEGGE